MIFVTEVTQKRYLSDVKWTGSKQKSASKTKNLNIKIFIILNKWEKSPENVWMSMKKKFVIQDLKIFFYLFTPPW